jgi:hypothetical protein
LRRRASAAETKTGLDLVLDRRRDGGRPSISSRSGAARSFGTTGFRQWEPTRKVLVLSAVSSELESATAETASAVIGKVSGEEDEEQAQRVYEGRREAARGTF